ncbi:MAG: 30S ribosomal protein S18 [Clostridiales bacterium]|nr:30S ribosomal protein S18 [Clostridiales bacterium]
MAEKEKEKRGKYRGKRIKKKVCLFCADKSQFIDYKHIVELKSFTSERGKILPRRVSGCCAKHQRQITIAVKRARYLSLLPYVAS